MLSNWTLRYEVTVVGKSFGSSSFVLRYSFKAGYIVAPVEGNIVHVAALFYWWTSVRVKQSFGISSNAQLKSNQKWHSGECVWSQWTEHLNAWKVWLQKRWNNLKKPTFRADGDGRKGYLLLGHQLLNNLYRPFGPVMKEVAYLVGRHADAGHQEAVVEDVLCPHGHPELLPGIECNGII